MAVDIQVKVNVQENDALQKLEAISAATANLESKDITININTTGLDNITTKSVEAVNAYASLVRAAVKYNDVQQKQEKLDAQRIRAQAADKSADARIMKEKRLTEANGKLAESTKALVEEEEKAIKQKGLLERALGKPVGEYLLNRAAYMAVTESIRSVTNAFKEALGTMKEVDSELASIQKVTDFSAEQMKTIEEGAYQTASKYGVSAQEYLESVSAFAKAGYKDLADDLGELAIKTQLVGDVNASTANKFLLAVDAAWKMGGSVTDLSRVLDEANTVENNYATSIDKLAQGMPNVASVASMVGMSAEETIAALGTITAVTQQSGTKAATALRALILNIMKDTTTEVEEGVTVTKEQISTLDEVLQTYAADAISAAEATGEIVNPMKVVAALSEAYNDKRISKRDLAKIETALGGKLRTVQLDALLKNFDMYEKMMGKIAESAGSADKEVGIMLDTWDAKAKILKNTWTEFVAKTISTDIFKGILDSATKLLNVVGDLGTVFEALGGILVAKFVPKIASKVTDAINSFWASLRPDSDSWWDGSKPKVSGGKLAFSAITAGITAAIIVYQKYRQSVKEAMESSLKEAEQTSESSAKLFELVDAYESAEEGSQAMKIASAQLASALGLEGEAVDSLKSKYQELTEAKLKEATGDAAEAMANVSKAIDTEFQFNSDRLTVGRGGGKIADIINRNLKDFYDEESGYYHAGLTTESKIAFARAAKQAEADVKAYASGIKDEFERNKIFDSSQYSDLDYINKTLSEYILNYDAASKLVERSGFKEDIFKAQYNGHIETQEDFERYRDSLKATIEDQETLTAVLDTLDKAFPEFASNVEDATGSLDENADAANKAKNALEAYKNALSSGGEKDDNFQTMSDAFDKMVEAGDKGYFGSNAFQEGAKLLFGADYVQGKSGEDILKHAKELKDVFSEKSMGRGLFDLITGSDFAEAEGNITKITGAFGELAKVTKNEDGSFDFKITDDPQGLAELAGKLQVSAESIITMQQAMGMFDVNVDTEGLEQQLSDVSTMADELAQVRTMNFNTNEQEVIGQIGGIQSAAEAAAKNYVMNFLANLSVSFSGGGGGNGGGGGGNGGNKPMKSATGTSDFKGGLTWVNDEKGGFNPELIETGGKSFFVNGGKPALVSLPKGTIIHNATDTRKLFAQDFMEVPHHKSGTGIPLGSIADRSGRIAGIGNGNGSASSGDWWEKLKEYMEDLLEKAGDALDKQLEAIDAELFYLQYGKEVSEKATKLEEARMDLLEAEQELINAQTERTVRYFNAETGQWEWMADQKDILKAQEDLAEKQKDYLQAQYDYLEDVWSELKDDIQKAIDGKKDVDIASVLKQMLKSKAGGLTGNVEGLIGDLLNLITAFSNGTALDSYDSGGIANGLGYMYKATKADEVVLNGKLSNAILSPKRSQQFADFTSSLEKMFGMSSMMERPRSMAGFSTSDNHSTNVYMNGIKIGSDMLNKPLSEVLSVLPIYCN